MTFSSDHSLTKLFLATHLHVSVGVVVDRFEVIEHQLRGTSHVHRHTTRFKVVEHQARGTSHVHRIVQL